jgi:quinol monooxygenase YgiN
MVRMVAREGREDELLALLAQMATLAAKDDGCEVYAVHRARREPNVFFLYELYRDKDSFKAHQQNEDLKAVSEGLGDLTESIELVVGNLVAGDVAVRR